MAGQEEHKLAAYADDVLFYISNPQSSLIKVIEALDEYGKISNFKINQTKSEILNINVSKQEEQIIQGKCRFKWAKELKYLGIKLARTLDKMFHLNYIPLLNEIKAELRKKQCIQSVCVFPTDGSSNGNPPERCPRPLYSRDSTQEGHTIPHHHQGEELKDTKVEVKVEEDETLISGDQQSMEEGGHLYSRDSTQESHTIPHHHQGEELKDIKVETKEDEEEMLVSGDQQSMEEGKMIMKSKQEESSLDKDTSK
ncbi:uncharacterized protein LOC143955409 [Lithobates pipiens]